MPAALTILLITMALPGAFFRETIRYSIQGVALTAVFTAAIHWPKWAVFRVLNWRPLTFLGVLSYSMYLMHHAIIFAVRQIFKSSGITVQAILAFVVTLEVAWLLYLAIERPCARLRRRFTD